MPTSPQLEQPKNQRFDIKRAAKPLTIMSLYLIAFKSLMLFYTLIAITACSLYILFPEQTDDWIAKNQIMLTGSALCFLLAGGGMIGVVGLAAGAWIGHVAQKMLHEAEQRTRPIISAYKTVRHPGNTLNHSIQWAANVCKRGVQQGKYIIVHPTRNVCQIALQSAQTRIQTAKDWFISNLSLFRRADNEDNESFITAASHLTNDVADLRDFFTEDESDEDSDNEARSQPTATYLPRMNTNNDDTSTPHDIPPLVINYARSPLHPK